MRRRAGWYERGSTGDAGSATLELVVLTPALLALLVLILAAARISSARQQVDEAARDAARAASLQPDLAAAERMAEVAAASDLDSHATTCAPMTVTVRGDYQAPPGTPAATYVRVSCTASLADLSLPGLPGSTTLRADYSAVLDTYSTRGQP